MSEIDQVEKRYTQKDLFVYGGRVSRTISRDILGEVMIAAVGRGPLKFWPEQVLGAIELLAKQHPNPSDFLAELAGQVRGLACREQRRTANST
jgi:hypothetical protein